MKPRLYIHIGFPKTGSSTIQRFFNINKKMLKDMGLCYPAPLVGQMIRGHEGHCSMAKNSSAVHFDSISWDEYREMYLSALRHADCPVNLLSGETFVYDQPEIYLFFQKYFDLKFICCFRNGFDFLTSSIKQVIKEGCRLDLFSFFNDIGGLLLGRINEFVQLFGRDNFYFLNYDTVTSRGDLIFNFLKIINCEFDDRMVIPQRVNTTPLDAATMFLYQLSFLPFYRFEWITIRDEILKMDLSQWKLFKASFLPNHFFEIDSTIDEAILCQADLLNDPDWYAMTVERGKELAPMGTHDLPSEIQHSIWENLSDSARASIIRWWPKAANAKSSECVLPSLEKIAPSEFIQLIALRREFYITCGKVLQLSRKNDSLAKQSSVIKNTEKKPHVAHLNFISANPNILSPRIWDFLVLFSQSARQAYGIRRSGLFDIGWYLERYPDVAEAGIDPVAHYVRFGAKEGRDPAPWFSTSAYLQANPDVAANGVNPFYHYIRYGFVEGRKSFPCC